MFRIKNLPAHFLSTVGRGRHFRPKATYQGETEQVIVLNRPPSSTVDIYVRPRFTNGALPVSYVDFPHTPPSTEFFTKKSFVIISRYINDPWCEALRKYKDKISGIAYLMDDNIPEAGFDHTLPPAYALGLARFIQKYGNRLQDLCSELWVSSPYLLERYNSPVTSLIDPVFVSRPRHPGADYDYVTIFYHAQRPHYQDNLWLRSVIVEIQRRYDNTVFETFGGEKVRKAYGTIPRSRVLNRFTWEGYLDYCAGRNYDIGLAPLNLSLFNRARSINKIFDISRCGAAGVYTDTEPYSTVIDSGKTGVLCEHNKTAWLDGICELIENEAKRNDIFSNCFRFCEEHNEKARTPESLKKLMNGAI